MSDDKVVVLDSSMEQALDFDGLRLLAVLKSSEAESSISSYLASFEGVEYELLDENEFAEQGVTINGETPDIFIIEVEDETEAAGHIQTLRSDPASEFLHICILMRAPTKTATVNLLRMGADDILSISPKEIELTGSLARSASNRAHDGRSNRSQIRTTVFLHASGGAGATTLAVNSAVQMQKNAKKLGGNACLIDLDLQFGDADLHLDLSMRSNLIDLIRSPDRLDFRMLENLTVTGPEGLRVLTAPDEPLPLEALSKETVENILLLARRHYRHVIIDMPISLTSWTDTVLRRADRIFLVTQINVVALRSARRLVDTLHQENLSEIPIIGIANRYPSRGPDRKITIAEAEKTLRIPIKQQIPSDFSLLINSLDQGAPASMQQPNSKYSNIIRDLFDETAETESDKKAGKFGASFLRFGGR